MKEFKKHLKKILAAFCALALTINCFYGISMNTKAEETQAERNKPWEKGYVRVTPKDFGIQDGNNHKTEFSETNPTQQISSFYKYDYSMNKKYLDMTLAFPSNAESKGVQLNLASENGDAGIRVQIIGGKLCLFDAWGGSENGIKIPENDLGAFTEEFNLQVGFEMSDYWYGVTEAHSNREDAPYCKLLKVTVWSNGEYIAEKEFENVRAAGHNIGYLTGETNLTIKTPMPNAEEKNVTPEDFGLTRTTLLESHGIIDGVYENIYDVNKYPLSGINTLDMKYYDMDLEIHSNNSNACINIATTGTSGWTGIRLEYKNNSLRIGNPYKYDDDASTFKNNVSGLFNIKLGLDLGTITGNVCDSITMYLWINDEYVGTKTAIGVEGVGNYIGIAASNGNSIKITTPSNTPFRSDNRITSSDLKFEEETDFSKGAALPDKTWTLGTHKITGKNHSYGIYYNENDDTAASLDGKFLDFNVRYGKNNTEKDQVLYLADDHYVESVTIGTPNRIGTEQGAVTPASLGYNTAVPMSTFFNAQTQFDATPQYNQGARVDLKKKYIETNVTFLNATGASLTILATSGGWEGIRIAKDNGELKIYNTNETADPGLNFTAQQLDLGSLEEKFNLKIGVDWDEFNSSTGIYKNIKIAVWINDIYRGTKTWPELTGAGEYGYVYIGNSGETLYLEDDSTNSYKFNGYSRVLMSDFGFEDKTYGPSHGEDAVNIYKSTKDVDLNNKYIDMDVAFNSDDDKTTIRLGNNDVGASGSWCGIIVGTIKSSHFNNEKRLCVYATIDGSDAGHLSGLSFTADELGLASFKEKFNLKLGFVKGTMIGTTCSSVKVTVWVNDRYMGERTFENVANVGNKVSICVNEEAEHENGWGGIGVALADGKLIFSGEGVAEEREKQIFEYDANKYGIVAGRFFNLKLYTRRSVRANGLADVLVRAKINGQEIPAMNFKDLIQYGESMGIYTPAGNIGTQAVKTTDNPFTFTVDEEASEILPNGDAKVVLKTSVAIIGQQEEAMYEGLEISPQLDNIRNVKMIKNNRGAFELIIPQAKIPADGKFVLKAGRLINMEHTVTMKHGEDFTFYVNSYGVSEEQSIAKVAEHTIFFRNTEASSSPILETNNTTINGIFTAVDNPNQGIFINGVKDEEAQLVWDTDKTYHISFSKEVKQGDIVVVYGDFRSGNSVISLSTAVAVWDSNNIWHDNPAEKLESLLTVKHETNAIVYDITDQTHIVKTENTTYKKLVDDGKNLDDVPENYAAISLNGAVYEEGLYGFICKIGVTSIRYYVRLTASTREDATPVPEGPTGSGRQITSVTKTTHGTQVIGVSDTKNGYQPDTETFDAYGYDYVLDFDSDREFKILQITDTQIRIDTDVSKEKMDELAFGYIRELVKKTNPDLILVTGDSIYGKFDDAEGTIMKAFVAFMETLKIPWAPVYGNHENESDQGVEGQNTQYEEAEYCLFNTRHSIGGNGNYSIGISRNGVMERVVYMMDSNGCGTAHQPDVSSGAIKTTRGFTPEQIEWYYNMALRTNSIAGKTIPNMLGFHIQNDAVVEGAMASIYWFGNPDDSKFRGEIGIFAEAQEGDMGYVSHGVSYGNMITGRQEYYVGEPAVAITKKLIKYMNQTGGDGAFFGHEHYCDASISYAGVRWTFGLKTGTYEAPQGDNVGGTVVQLSNNSQEFTVTHVPVKEIATTTTDTVEQEDTYYDLANGAYLLQGENVKVNGVSQYTGWELNQPGVYEVSSIKDGIEYTQNVHLYLTGDVNLDGEAGTAGDWTALKAMVYDPGKTDSTKAVTAAQYAADLDNDGKVGFTDVHLAQDIVDKEATLQAVKDQYDIPVQTYDHIGGEEVMPIIGTTADTYIVLKGTGVNMINTEGDAEIKPEEMQEILENCDKDGIGVLVSDKELEATSSTYNDYFVNAAKNLFSATEAAQVMSVYSSHPSYVGNYMVSGELVEDTSYILNTYTNTQGVLRTDAENANQFIEETNPTVLTAEGSTVAATHLATLEAIRTAAVDNKLPFWANVKVEGADAKTYWNANIALALGAKGIEWDSVSNKATTVKAMNEHIAAVDEVLLRAKSAEVINTANEATIEGRKLVSYTAENATIGCFDYRDTEAYYVVNNNVEAEQKVTLTLANAHDYRMIAEAKETYGTSETITFTIPAGQGVLIALEDRSVEYRNLAEYRGTVEYQDAEGNTVTCTRNRTKTEDGEINTFAAADAAPGYIFAGWYEVNENNTLDRTTFYKGTGETAVAKFVPDETLTIKAQVRDSVKTAGNKDLRFVTSVDNLEYEKMGFDVAKPNANGDLVWKKNESKWVYAELAKLGDLVKPTEWCAMSNWFRTVSVTNIPPQGWDTPITAKSYWITFDGTKVYGETVTRTVNESPDVSGTPVEE